MNHAKFLLPRLWAFCAMLCMVAVMNGSLVASQAMVMNLQHQISGDIKLADGGWQTNCDGQNDDCKAHVSAPDHGNDLADAHHHHSGETHASGLIPLNEAPPVPGIVRIALLPGSDQQFSSRTPATPDQPPRV